MGDTRDFEVKEQDGGLLGESNVELHEYGGGDYSMSGKDAKKFMRNKHRMDIESETESGITFVDRKTGERVFAGREESSLPGIIMGVIVLIGVVVMADCLPTLAMAPVVAISMVHTFPWGPLLLIGMVALFTYVCSKVRSFMGYRLIMGAGTLLMATVSLLIMRFGMQDQYLIIDGLEGLVNTVGGVIGVTLLCAGLVNTFILMAGIILRRGLVIRPAIGMLVLLPAVAMMIGGVVCAMTGDALTMSHAVRGSAIATFLDNLPYTPWPWLQQLLDKIIFGHKPLIVALIGLISSGVLALVELKFGLLTYGD